MALHRILVVHDSPAVRETVGILLGGEYEVRGASVDEFRAVGVTGDPPHVIIAAPRLSVREVPRSAAIVWVGDGRRTTPPAATLRHQFSPVELRRIVREALSMPTQAPAGIHSRLLPPFVPRGVAAVLAEAARSALPLHLRGEAGVGKRAIARAVHASRGGELLSTTGSEIATALDSPPAGTTTLVVNRLEALGGADQQRLLQALQPSGTIAGRDGAEIRLITISAAPIDEMIESGAFSPELFYRVTLLTAPLPPLRERADDIAALARALAADLGIALERPGVSLSDAALERLRHYLWFGNVAELEAVLARSIALGTNTVVDASDLLFDGARIGRAANSPPPSPQRLAPQQLDLIINELAHEFKNPLVALKTFAHHLRRQPGGDDEQEVARLTSEAVDRIDHTLENLLEFTRLDAPAAESVSLPVLVDAARRESEADLTLRRVRLDCEPAPPWRVSGDPQQLTYALTNLVRSLVRDLAPGTTVQLGFVAPVSITLRLPPAADPLGNHLAALLGHAAVDGETTPLGVAIAHAVFSRNGAQLTVDAEDPSQVVIRLRQAEDDPRLSNTNGSHGTDTRTGR